MASGDTLFQVLPHMVAGPSSSFAQPDIIAGASTPPEMIPVLAFDPAATEYADFLAMLPANYAGGGLTITLVTAAGTTTGGMRWELAIRRIADDDEDLDTTAHIYDFNGVTVATLPSAVGEVTHDNVTFTAGADMDFWVAGELAILRARRKHDDAGDTAAADGYLHAMHVKET